MIMFFFKEKLVLIKGFAKGRYGCKMINTRSKNYKNMIPKKYIDLTINI